LANDREIQSVFDSCQARFQVSEKYFAMISNPDADIQKNISAYGSQLKGFSTRLEQEKQFLKKYFNTRKPLRKTLFYHY
jgi:hypothetical protein